MNTFVCIADEAFFLMEMLLSLSSSADLQTRQHRVFGSRSLPSSGLRAEIQSRHDALYSVVCIFTWKYLYFHSDLLHTYVRYVAGCEMCTMKKQFLGFFSAPALSPDSKKIRPPVVGRSEETERRAAGCCWCHTWDMPHLSGCSVLFENAIGPQLSVGLQAQQRRRV